MLGDQLEWFENRLTNDYVDVKTDCHKLEMMLLSSKVKFLDRGVAHQSNKSQPIVEPYRGFNQSPG